MFFQNCGDLNSVDRQSFSGNCETILMNTFKNTYYESLKNKCAGCHSLPSGPGLGMFASFEFSKAFDSFNSMGRSRVERNLLNESHQPGVTGSLNQPLVNKHAKSWKLAEDNYALCVKNKNSENLTPVTTLYKSDSRILEKLNTDDPWVKLSWNLESEILATEDKGKFKLILSLSIAAFTNPTRYEIKDLKMGLADNFKDSYTVNAVNILMNGKVLEDVTTYSLAKKQISSQEETELVENASSTVILLDKFNGSGNDTFAVYFENIIYQNSSKDPNDPSDPGGGMTVPNNVTYADLISDNMDINVFKRACLNCHNANLQRGGLNLENQNQARNAVNNIISRMNNSGNPMPPSGILNAYDRALIDKWKESEGL